MTDYRHDLHQLGEIAVSRDDVAGVTTIRFRDKDSRTIVDLPDGSMGPDLLLQLVNRGVAVADKLGYGREIATPESLAKAGGRR